MGEVSVSVGLTEQQRDFVRFIVSGGRSPEEAGALCGYHPKSVYRLLKMPAVAGAIHEAIQQDLVSVGAPAAYRVAKALMLDEKVSARVRADISFKLMDRAGHIVPTRKDLAPGKALSEMSRDELASFIKRNQAEIDRAEQEAAGRAIDITPQHAAPVDAKPLNFLD
ncbi:phage terminase small subunit [Bradyrhizobium stylosanthis]|uniref:Phage terminase small subunit n=2 Tax=Bradyrhizobium stylosanthis TaxID=1803665 RepID=A0A560CXK8_9BRAD|nr:phage terminase small subunit [Bradyrhizobium stylosanthis]